MFLLLNAGGRLDISISHWQLLVSFDKVLVGNGRYPLLNEELNESGGDEASSRT